MPIRDVFKISRKTFFNPTGWLDLSFIVIQTKQLINMLKGSFSPDKPARVETFAEAMHRLHLSDEDVRQGAQHYRRFALFFVLLGALVFFYSFFLLFAYHTLAGWLLGLLLTGLLFSQAFRYDFWAYQMRQRKLGVTFNNWKKNFLKEFLHD